VYDSRATIVGRVISDELEIKVSAWQSDEVSSTYTDNAGYFSLLELKPGLYDIRVESPSGYSTRVKNVVAEAGETVNLPEIELDNNVWPVYNLYPRDNSIINILLHYFRFYSFERIEMDSLKERVKFNPNLTGTWYEDYNYEQDYYFYRFSLDDNLLPGQSYTWTFPAGLKFESGDSLTKDIVTQFTVESFRLRSFGFQSSYNPYNEIKKIIDPEEANRLLLKICFNASVDTDSLLKACSFDFPIEGIWFYFDEDYGYGFMYWFFASNLFEFAPDSQYTMSLSGSINLSGEMNLGNDTTLTIITNPLQIEDVKPSNGARNISQSSNITIDFNAEMNQPITEAAFSLTTWNGTPVDGSFSWDAQNYNKLYFDPTFNLNSGEAYKITVDTTAETTTGHRLKDKFISFFATQ
jgi:hypothetical protein